ncbi:zinc ribbon domain-containing protein [Spongisporangium articulatum]|uniref:Zinc ribbon domain-containing protein n=1 Tax=Spongisporangium articulatum TaxID=3362603 RepID=A0ABW8ALT3_9ACTN
MVTAAPQDQWRLLDVQDLDTRLAQLAHRRRTLPEHEKLRELETQERAKTDDAVRARTELGDLRREVSKAEADVEQVRARLTRDQQRLDSGTGSAKDLTNLQHEVESLTNRIGVLEDVELEVMERQETAEVTLAAVEGELDEVQQQLVTVRAALEEQVAAIDADVEKATRERSDAAAGVPKPLLDLYEKVRERTGGVGAAKLFQRRCEGCRLELNNQELGELRAAPEDLVYRHEECGRILVRTGDSGL